MKKLKELIKKFNDKNSNGVRDLYWDFDRLTSSGSRMQ